MKSKLFPHFYRRLRIGIVLLFLFAIDLKAFSQSGKEIIGNWKSTERDLFQVEIYLAKDGSYYGKVINDANSPSNIGKLILNKLEYEILDHSYSGILTPPESNFSANALITFESKDKLKITMRKLIFTKTLTLIRI